MQTIKVKCERGPDVNLSDLQVIQGDLKELSLTNYEKLKSQILEKGFNDPFNVWDDEGQLKILDGTQRFRTLSQMQSDGYEIPKLPTNIVKAETIKEAIEILIAHASDFGQMTEQGLYELIEHYNVDLNFLTEKTRQAEIDQNHFIANFYSEPVKEDEEPQEQKDPFCCPSCGHRGKKPDFVRMTLNHLDNR